MASVTQENIGLQHEKITVQIEKNDYLPDFEKSLKNYSKNIQLQGFRKGMVPLGMVKKMHGAAIFQDEIVKLAGNKLEQYLIEQKKEIFARPLPAESQAMPTFDMNNPTDYTFEFEVAIRPDFLIHQLDNNHTMPLYKVTVTDKMVDEEVDKLKYKAGKMLDPETITCEDNVLNVTFEQCDAEGNIIEGGIKKDNSLLLKYFTTPLQSKLMDKKAGDSIQFNLQNTFDEKLLPAILKDLNLNPALEEDKNTEFKLTITKVGLVEKAVLGPEMYESIYAGQGIETEEQFRTKLKLEIELYWASQSKVRLHNEIFEELVHNVSIPMPVKFLKRWMSVGGERYVAPEAVEKEYSTFEHQLRWQIISDKIARDFGIQVTPQEMEYVVKQQISGYFDGMTFDEEADWIKDFVKKQLQDKKVQEDTYHKILTDKLFAEIEPKFVLQETEIDVEKFIALPNAHDGHHHH
jgi:trigger factor